MVRKNLLRGFKKPKGITFEHSEVEANYGRFVAYPFERGYGVTIGNTLRQDPPLLDPGVCHHRR